MQAETTLQPPLVDDPAAITAEWLTTVLNQAGHDTAVRTFRRAPIGTGQMAHNERFELEFEGDPDGAPQSLVIKFPSPNAESRASGARGGYRSEVKFYTELASQLTIRIPRCYCGVLSEDESAFTLVLEDLAPAVQGDQIAGASDEEIESAVQNLAGLHAPFWGDPRLDDIDWLLPPDPSQIDAIMAPATEMFLDRYAVQLSKNATRVMKRFGEAFSNWRLSQPAPESLVHGDYRLDNLLFAPGNAASQVSPVAAVDWQTLALGSGVRDLAYLLGNSAPPERRRQHESHMLAVYRAAMAARGVSLTSSEVDDRYRHGSFHGPFITILGSLAVGQTERGDAMFMAMAERSTAQIIDLDALDLLD